MQKSKITKQAKIDPLANVHNADPLVNAHNEPTTLPKYDYTITVAVSGSFAFARVISIMWNTASVES